MIVKRNFNPIKVACYVWRDAAQAAGVGTALSIFLAFRASSAFARWNEAAQVWAIIGVLYVLYLKMALWDLAGQMDILVGSWRAMTLHMVITP